MLISKSSCCTFVMIFRCARLCSALFASKTYPVVFFTSNLSLTVSFVPLLVFSWFSYTLLSEQPMLLHISPHQCLSLTPMSCSLQMLLRCFLSSCNHNKCFAVFYQASITISVVIITKSLSIEKFPIGWKYTNFIATWPLINYWHVFIFEF